MFDSLSERLQGVFRTLRGEARLSEPVVESALREIRMALLEADVNFKVVKAFTDRVRERAIGQDVARSLTPGQQVVKIVRDELVALFGDAQGGLRPSKASPQAILLLGLQGAGKTTAAAKLAKWLVRQGRHPLLVSTDVRRPAAIEQLNVLGQQAGLRVFDPAGELDPVARATGALTEARQLGFDIVIVDTAGRLHIDDTLMQELTAIRDAVEPDNALYVADAMTGQDAIKSAGEFNRRIGVTGVVLTKLDGDARGGAALSVVAVVGVPIAFVGVGERLEDLEPFQADRLVSRLLGMGDVLSLIERAEQVVDRDEAERLGQKLRSDDFTLEDFLAQLKTLRRMGPLEQVLGMLPGMGSLKQLGDAKPDEAQTGRRRGDHQLDDARRAAELQDHRRQPPSADREGERHDRRGRQPPAPAVPADAEDAEGGRRRGRGRRPRAHAASDGHAQGARPGGLRAWKTGPDGPAVKE